MKSAIVYLFFNGNCEEAFNFYKEAIGGQSELILRRYAELPTDPNMPPIPEQLKQKIMHLTLKLSDGVMIFGSDIIEGFGSGKVNIGNNFSISLGVESKEQADKIFSNLSEGGKVTMPIGDTFWGSYFGSFIDKFGVGWMIDYLQANQS